MPGGGGFRGGGGGGFRGGGFGGFRGGGFRDGRFGFRGNRFFGFSPFFNSGFYGYPYWGGWDPFWFDSSDYGNGYPPAYGSSPYPYVSYSGGGTPAVVINQNSGGYPYAPPPEQAYAPPPPPPAPAIREYTSPTTQAQQQYQAPLYLIAFSDGVIRAVVAYWVDGTTLHYVTMDHEQKQAPLSTVDRGLSGRLNQERNVTFALPH